MERKEAIEVIKKNYPDSNFTMLREALETLIPELKESEDENVRKFVQYIKKEAKAYEINFPNRDYDIYAFAKDILSWLEKRGGQKPKFRAGDTIKCKYDDRQFTIKSVDLDKGTYIYTQEGCGNDIDYADEEFELVEQKPAWSEEDEKMLNSFLHKLEFCDLLSIKEGRWIKSKLKSLRPQSTWKPSDEQMDTLEHYMHTLICTKYKEILFGLYSDLKKLKE